VNHSRPTPRRRALLAGLLGSAFHGMARSPAAHAQAQPPLIPFADGATLIVAGPDDGDLDAWAHLLRHHLARFLPADMRMPIRTVGGHNGITAANQFEAQAHPDGSSLLLVPGSAALGWILGDARVQFDIGKWVPLLHGFCPLALAGRTPAGRLRRGQRLRIGLSSPIGPEWAAILGLTLIGLKPEPVPGILDEAMAISAYLQGSVDLVLLRGPGIDTGISTSGASPICILGSPPEIDVAQSHSPLNGWPRLEELLDGMPDTPIATGWSSAALAAQLAITLTLPQLTPAAIIAFWRHATAQILAEMNEQVPATSGMIQLYSDPGMIKKLTGTHESRTNLRAWYETLPTTP